MRPSCGEFRNESPAVLDVKGHWAVFAALPDERSLPWLLQHIALDFGATRCRPANSIRVRGGVFRGFRYPLVVAFLELHFTLLAG